MIITLDEVKTILQIDVDTNDSLINMFIPLVEQDIVDYCKNDFIDEEFDFFSSNDITFVNSDNSINLTNISTKKIVANDSIRVYKSFRNNQVFTVSSVSTNKIIINSIDTIQDEDESETVYITKVKYPIPLKFVAAKMINYQLTTNTDEFTPGMKSEKIDDYTITLEDTIQGYPLSYMVALQRYRHLFKKDLFSSLKVIL
jgi:hypothetical protein